MLLILSGYAQDRISASGLLVNPGRLSGSATEVTSGSGQLIVTRSPIQPFPEQDSTREGRILSALSITMHRARSTEFDVWAKQSIGYVLSFANTKKKWWFLENVAAITLPAGSDVIDLRGHLDRVITVYAPARLNLISLSKMVALRQEVQARGAANAGTPTHYAMEAGKRLHLWPAPSIVTAFAALYTRPMAIETVPDEWEFVIHDGVVGRYGRHYDRDTLVQDPEAFENRFLSALNSAPPAHWDIERAARWDDVLPAGLSVTANSSLNSATAYVVPASLTGIGYVSIDMGDYPLGVV